jgi:hypothetical protein
MNALVSAIADRMDVKTEVDSEVAESVRTETQPFLECN